MNTSTYTILLAGLLASGCDSPSISSVVKVDRPIEVVIDSEFNANDIETIKIRMTSTPAWKGANGIITVGGPCKAGPETYQICIHKTTLTKVKSLGGSENSCATVGGDVYCYSLSENTTKKTPETIDCAGNCECVQSNLVAHGYDIGGVDGICGPRTQVAWDKCQANKICTGQLPRNDSYIGVGVPGLIGDDVLWPAGDPSHPYPPLSPDTWARTCPNGDCFGVPSTSTGLPRTNYVHPYTKSDGVLVGGYYRSHK